MFTQEHLKLVEDAANLIRKPENWTQNTFARDNLGCPIGPTHPAAVCWCSGGALIHCGSARTMLRDVVNVTLNNYMAKGIVNFNDTHTHAEVIAAWDAIIADMKKQLAT